MVQPAAATAADSRERGVMRRTLSRDGGRPLPNWLVRSRYWLDGDDTSMPVAQEPGLIDLEPTGISSWLVAANGTAHLVAMAVALMLAALRSPLVRRFRRCVGGAAARRTDGDHARDAATFRAVIDRPSRNSTNVPHAGTSSTGRPRRRGGSRPVANVQPIA